MEDVIITMDDQQRSLENRLHWLGGIIDGEGCITLNKRQEKKNNVSYRPNIFITNTDDRIIEEACDILNSYGIAHYVWSSNYREKDNHKTKTDIMISGFMRCVKALPIIIPVLVSKRHRAQLLLDYCKRRLSMPKSSTLTNIDLRYVQWIREANNRGQFSKPLRDYTPGVGV